MALVLAAATPAGADTFGPISLVSESATEQAVYAHDPVISGNGRYVAFDGYFDGLEGVWRKDLQTGAVQEVAAVYLGQTPGPPALPSISENGQYVSFTTTARLAPVYDTQEDPSVYVRNMDIEASQPCTEYTPEELAAQPPPTLHECAYTLVSAVSGAPTGLTYMGTKGTADEEGFGSLASGRTAISGDGQEVAFVTTAYSDLTSGQAGHATTPPLQVAVRNLATEETQLVSVARSLTTGLPEPGQPVYGEASGVRYGAVHSSGLGPPTFPDTARAYGMTPAVGASISADGSTVAWMGASVDQQAATLSHEQQQLAPSYAEPLWRRIANGPEAPTRRVTGGSEPEDPACQASGEQELGLVAPASDPCQGPFLIANGSEGTFTGASNAVPQLSANGELVAFLATAPLVARGNDFGLAESAPADLYLADMRPGLTRSQALKPLTQFSGTAAGEAEPIADVALSADGTQVAFATRRTVFALASLTYVSAPMSLPGMCELFDIDLADDTLTRVTHGFEGGAGEHPHPTTGVGIDPYRGEDGSLSPSFSADGEKLAFSSTASNLVYGDGNTPSGDESLTFDGSDAFVVSRVKFGTTATPQTISAAPAVPALQAAWRLGATAHTGRHGEVELSVALPGAGSLRAVADASVAIRAPARASRDARRRRRGVSARRRSRRDADVVTRAIAAASEGIAQAPAEGALATLRLVVTPRYRRLAAARDGLPATVYLTFTAPGHPAIHESLEVTFLVAAGARSTLSGHTANHAAGGRR